MAANNGSNEKPMVPITCPRCSTRFSVPMPEGVVTNSVKFSSFIVTHERLVKCISCPQRFVLGIENVGINYGVEAIPDEIANTLEESRIILPGPRSIEKH